jgi:hypothetical protein
MSNDYYEHQAYEAHMRMEDMHGKYNNELNELGNKILEVEMNNQLAIREIARLTQENFELIQIIQQLLNNGVDI